MKKLTFIILGVQMFSENARGNSAAIIIKPSNQLLKKDGTPVSSVELNSVQFQRVVTRALGIFNPIGFKHIAEACNGSAKLTIDALDCKEGEAFTKADGSTDTYKKTWTKYSNHSISLGIVGAMKLAELSLSASFAQAAEQYAMVPTVKKVVVGGASDDNTGTEGSNIGTEGSKDEDPQI